MSFEQFLTFRRARTGIRCHFNRIHGRRRPAPSWTAPRAEPITSFLAAGAARGPAARTCPGL